MKHRDRAIRTVLVGAALASMATSAPPGDYLEVTGTGTVRAPGGTFVRVALDPTVAAEADDIRVQIELEVADGVSATVTPVGVGLGTQSLAQVVEYGLDDLCPDRKGCVPELRLDARGGGAAVVVVTVLMTRYGDPSFCFPDEPRFSSRDGGRIEFHD